MNIPALILAALCAGYVFMGFHYAQKQHNKLRANMTKIGSVTIAVLIMVMIPSILQWPSQMSAKVGEYWFYWLFAGAIMASLFGKRKKQSSKSDDK